MASNTFVIYLTPLSLNKAKLTGTFIDVPERLQVEEPFNEQLVIELYSK